MANLRLKIGTLSTNKNRNYLYKDINSNIRFNSNKTDVINNTDINAVLGSLRNLFEYSPGERILEPEFGISFNDILYEPMSEKAANLIGMKIFNGVKQWEPRIKISNINVFPDFGDNTYYITLAFTINGIKTKEDIYFDYNLRRQL